MIHKDRITSAIRLVADADGELRAALLANEQVQEQALQHASESLAAALKHTKLNKRRK